MHKCVSMFKWGGAPCVHIHLEARSQWWVSSSIHLINWDKVFYWSWSSLVPPLYPKIPVLPSEPWDYKLAAMLDNLDFKYLRIQHWLSNFIHWATSPAWGALSHKSPMLPHGKDEGEEESKIYSMKTGVCKTVNHSHCYEANNWLQRIYCYVRLIVKYILQQQEQGICMDD